MAVMLRLKKRNAFVDVASNGASVLTKGLVLQYKKRDTNDCDDCRVGFTVTKKIGGAVVRNRIKRRLRALSALVFTTLAKPGYDYVIIGRKAAIGRSFDALLKDLKYAMHQVN